jgi:hypothetical protein
LGKLGPTLDTAVQEGTQAEFLLHSTGSLETEGGWEVGGVLETPKKKFFIKVLHPKLCGW